MDFPSLSPRVCPNSCPLSWWGYPIISSSVILFSFCLQSFPEPGSFSISQLFASGGQSTRAWASTSVLPTNIQDLFPLGLTGLTSLQSKWLSRISSSTMNHSLPVFSSIRGIFQARILERVAISIFRGPSQPESWTCVSDIDRWILYHWANIGVDLSWYSNK